MDLPGLLVLPLLAWLSSGLAAVALAPRNLSAQVLAVTGALWPVSWQLELVGRQTLADLTFLCGLVGVVALLLTFPAGRFETGWHRYVVLGFAVLAVAGPLLALASPMGEALVASEPAWLVIGAALLIARFVRSGPDGRRELLPLLVGIATLAGLLLVVVTTAVVGLDSAGVAPWVFLPALAVLPVVLLWGISRRTRSLDRDLVASRARLSEAEDGVRRRIERDLHDGVQQQLVAILSLTELAARQVARDPASATATLEDVRGQAEAAITDLRELVSGIRPPVLQDAGIAAALSSRLDKLPDAVSLRVNAEATEEARERWQPEIEAAAYFVVCEAVTNALKHADAAQVQIVVDERTSQLEVEVLDDGRGIGPRVSARGLAGLRDRVESLGGCFEVGVAVPRGTSVRARFERGGS